MASSGAKQAGLLMPGKEGVHCLQHDWPSSQRGVNLNGKLQGTRNMPFTNSGEEWKGHGMPENETPLRT